MRRKRQQASRVLADSGEEDAGEPLKGESHFPEQKRSIPMIPVPAEAGRNISTAAAGRKNKEIIETGQKGPDRSLFFCPVFLRYRGGLQGLAPTYEKAQDDTTGLPSLSSNGVKPAAFPFRWNR